MSATILAQLLDCDGSIAFAANHQISVRDGNVVTLVLIERNQQLSLNPLLRRNALTSFTTPTIVNHGFSGFARSWAFPSLTRLPIAS